MTEYFKKRISEFLLLYFEGAEGEVLSEKEIMECLAVLILEGKFIEEELRKEILKRATVLVPLSMLQQALNGKVSYQVCQ